MICRRCLQRMRTSAPSSRCYLSSTTPIAAEETISTKTIEQAKPRGPGDQPSATSTASQPFTTPLGVSPTSRGMPVAKKPATPIIQSSVPAGTQLKGLNFLKSKSDPLAMEDSAYPPWLWTLLTPKPKASGVGGAADTADGDIYSKSKTKRQKAKKALKARGLTAGGVPVHEAVPLNEQTVDLPDGGQGSEEEAIEAVKARMGLTKAMREKRRADIKEANFLKTMR